MRNKRLARCVRCGGDIFFYDGRWCHEQVELDVHQAITKKIVQLEAVRRHVR